jgi:hypothetical protein
MHQLEMDNAILLASTAQLAEKNKDYYDQIVFWRKHLRHVLEGKPVIVKAIALSVFDPRKHCRQCESDWKSLVRFRDRENSENGEEKDNER